jgi:hypothetical protein
VIIGCLIMAITIACMTARSPRPVLVPALVATGRGMWELVVEAWQIAFRVNDHPGAQIRPRPNYFGEGNGEAADASCPENISPSAVVP